MLPAHSSNGQPLSDPEVSIVRVKKYINEASPYQWKLWDQAKGKEMLESSWGSSDGLTLLCILPPSVSQDYKEGCWAEINLAKYYLIC